MKKDILSYTYEELQEEMEKIGEKAFRAKAYPEARSRNGNLAGHRLRRILRRLPNRVGVVVRDRPGQRRKPKGVVLKACDAPLRFMPDLGS